MMRRIHYYFRPRGSEHRALARVLFVFVASCNHKSTLPTLLGNACKSSSVPATFTVRLPKQNGNATKIDLNSVTKLLKASFAGSNDAFVIPYGGDSLCHSGDGGVTWRRVALPTGIEPAAIFFLDPKNGWLISNAGGEPILLRTADGGGSWSHAAAFGPEGERNFTDLHFVNEKLGLAKGYFDVYITEDGGSTWKEVYSYLKTEEQPVAAAFESALVGWVLGNQHRVHRTIDGGQSWEVIAELKSRGKDLKPLRNGTVAVGSEGGVFTIPSQGQQDYAQVFSDRSLNIEAVDFLDAKRGFAVGYLDNDTYRRRQMGKSFAIDTRDGGANWIVLFQSPTDPFFADVRFVDENNGWIVGRDNLYRTTDGGKRWNFMLTIQFE